MTDQRKDKSWSDYVAMLRRRWRPTFGVSALIALGTIYVAYSLPAVYQSSATILIEEQGIPTDFVQTTVNTYAEQLLQNIYQRVVSTDNTLELIREFDLYADLRGSTPDEDLVARFRESTEMEPQNVTTVHARTGRETILTFGFNVSFYDPDPVKARDVAQELAERFVSQNSVIRSEVAQRTTNFLDSEASEIEKRLQELASRMADFKELHAGNLPDDQNVNLNMWERQRDELTRVETALRDARELKALLEAEIADVPRFRPVVDSSGNAVLGGMERLAEAQQELVRLRGRYSDNHPTIIALQREIASLSASPENRAGLSEQLNRSLAARRQELADARERYSESHPDVVRLTRTIASLEQQIADLGSSASSSATPNNPQYIQLRTRINTADDEISDLSARRADLMARIDDLDRRRLRAPQVEREFLQLESERGLLMERYRELRNLGDEAQLGQALETGQSGERLTIVEPARIPAAPVSPNRVSLSFLGIVLAIAAGLGIASLMDAMDTKVRGRQDIVQILDVAPIGTIPYVESNQDRARRLGINAAMGAATIAAIALVVSAVLGG